jgi:hypothetical protein
MIADFDPRPGDWGVRPDDFRGLTVTPIEYRGRDTATNQVQCVPSSSLPVHYLLDVNFFPCII